MDSAKFSMINELYKERKNLELTISIMSRSGLIYEEGHSHYGQHHWTEFERGLVELVNGRINNRIQEIDNQVKDL